MSIQYIIGLELGMMVNYYKGTYVFLPDAFGKINLFTKFCFGIGTKMSLIFEV